MNDLGKIPILSKYLVSLRIRGAKKSISKVRDRIKNIVEKQRQKVDQIVAAANNTDSARIITEANELRRLLEDAACVEVEFSEDPAIILPKKEVAIKAAAPVAEVRSKCIEFVTMKTRGAVVKRPGRAGWTEEERKLIEECQEKGGPNGWKP